ncbi:hypothetical protein [Acidipropionibacterium acidipropionici]|nr:hypothetical protein [Acidipropionibacterium acidipropionici]
MTHASRQSAMHRISLPMTARDADDLSRLRDDMAEDADGRPSQASVAHEAIRRGLDIMMWAEQQEQAYVELGEELRATAASRRERARSRRRGTAGPQ